MPTLTPEQVRDLLPVIWDLNPKAAKQALIAMIKILANNPSVKSAQFIEIMDDARKWRNDQ